MQTTFRYAQATLNATALDTSPGQFGNDLARFELAAMNSALVLVEALRKISSGVTGGATAESVARDAVEALGLREVTRAP